jgi:hypothetical protein
MPNAVSQAILTQSAEWLRDLQTPSSSEGPEARAARWEQVADLGEFGKSLSQLILRASLAEPTFAKEYLERVIGWESIPEKTFENIVAFSPVLAQSQPTLLVELTLKHLIEEPPTIESRERGQNSKRRLNGARRYGPSPRMNELSTSSACSPPLGRPHR